MIDIQHLTFTYPSQPAPLFDDFTWRVERGEFWSVIGASGCGKSTLLHLIVGVRAPSAGAITVNGERVPRKKHRGKTGLVLQDYGLLPWATVRQNVELGLRIREFYGQGQAAGSRQEAAGSKQQAASSKQQAASSRQQAAGSSQQAASSGQQAVLSLRAEAASEAWRERSNLHHRGDSLRLRLGHGFAKTAPRNDKPSRVDFWLERFGIAHLRDKYPAQISGGQRQRVAIARTLVLEPDVLLMDEPFAALDAPTREDLEQLTLDLQAETKTTLVFVTHNIEEAVFLGRKILVLGAPPHRSPPRVVENAGSGRAGYRDEPMFLEKARMLREMLKGQ